MAKEVIIFCDGCSKDITSTEGMPKFRLHLRAEKLSRSGPVYMGLVRPPIDKDKYFCNFSCLSSWMEGRENEAGT